MWFETLTGFEEDSGEQVRENLSVDGAVMVSAVSNRQMRCGVLELPSLAELRQVTSDLGSGASQLKLGQVIGEAGALHRDERNAGALFQAASQFNLLEMVSPEITPEHGVTRYQDDRTQGPACATSCGAGTIFRNYFIEVNGQIGQTHNNQINCLEDVATYLYPTSNPPWDVTNGYAIFGQGGLAQLNQSLTSMESAALDEVRGKLRIGVHHDVEVTSAGTGHTVSQAYCSALPVAYNQGATELFEPFGRLILDAAYEATLRSAVLNFQATGNPNVYLTMLGGGVFGNPDDWIIDAIERACQQVASVPLEVDIVSYNAPSPAVTELVDGNTRWAG